MDVIKVAVTKTLPAYLQVGSPCRSLGLMLRLAEVFVSPFLVS